MSHFVILPRGIVSVIVTQHEASHDHLVTTLVSQVTGVLRILLLVTPQKHQYIAGYPSMELSCECVSL